MTVSEVKELMEALAKSDLSEVKFEDETSSLVISKQERGKAQFAKTEEIICPSVIEKVEQKIEPVVVSSNLPEGNVVTSPLVGTVYMAPAEDAAPFVQVGDVVKKGQVLAIVEAMKLMNEIENEYDGTVKEILVENGQTVEYGQRLFVIG